VSSSGTLDDNTWHYIIAWHDSGLDKAFLQIDDSTVYSTTVGASLNAATSAGFYVGAYTNSSNYLNGMMDTVTRWDAVLTSVQRTWLYNAGAGRSCTDIIDSNATPTPTVTNTPTATPTPGPNPWQQPITGTLSTSNTMLLDRSATYGDLVEGWLNIAILGLMFIGLVLYIVLKKLD